MVESNKFYEFESQTNRVIALLRSQVGVLSTEVAQLKQNADSSIKRGYLNKRLAEVGVDLPVYANNAAAIAGGLTVGTLYRTGGNPDPVCVVH